MPQEEAHGDIEADIHRLPVHDGRRYRLFFFRFGADLVRACRAVDIEIIAGLGALTGALTVDHDRRLKSKAQQAGVAIEIEARLTGRQRWFAGMKQRVCGGVSSERRRRRQRQCHSERKRIFF